MSLRKEEIIRKILHIFSGSIIPPLILYIPLYAPYFSWSPQWLTPPWYAAILAAAMSLSFTIVELLRFKMNAVQRLFYRIGGAALRSEESKKMTGATYILYASLICSIIFVKNPSISFMVLCAFIWGDAAAAIVGQGIGRIKVGTKTLEGSIGCFALCLILFLAVFPVVPRLLDPWHGVMPVPMAVIASFMIAILELFPIPVKKNIVINDNLIVPVFTGIIILMLFPPIK